MDIETRISEIMQKVQAQVSALLLRRAGKTLTLSAEYTIKMLKKAGIDIKDEPAMVKRIVSKELKQYAENLSKGGSMCVERIVTPIGTHKVSVTSVEKFVPWLSDKTQKETSDIISLIREETAKGKNPNDMIKQLKPYLEGTKHNAETIARTESEKLRNDARFDSFRENKVQYVRYVTAGDDRVRPEHQQRNGKIYRIEDFPYLGEYNCRCQGVAADFDVIMQHKKVESSQAEVIRV